MNYIHLNVTSNYEIFRLVQGKVNVSYSWPLNSGGLGCQCSLHSLKFTVWILTPPKVNYSWLLIFWGNWPQPESPPPPPVATKIRRRSGSLYKMVEINANSRPSASVDSQSGMENTNFHLWLVESLDMAPADTEGQLYLLKKKSVHNWNCLVQTCVVQGSAVHVGIGIYSSQ